MGYIAPEVILRVGHDFQADIWSFGAILCEMIGGFSPFYHEDPKRMYENTLQGNIHWPTGINSSAKHLIS